jgi:hypothetical protein
MFCYVCLLIELGHGHRGERQTLQLHHTHRL